MLGPLVLLPEWTWSECITIVVMSVTAAAAADTANARSATRRPSFPGLANQAAAPATASGAIPHTTSR